MEIIFDRASKFYEPGERVGGLMNIKDWGTKFADLKNIVMRAESYMDTVS